MSIGLSGRQTGGGYLGTGSANTPASARRRPIPTPDRNDLTEEVRNQPLPYDASPIYNRINELYLGQLEWQRQAAARQEELQRQYNAMIDPNAGYAQHQQMLELLAQQGLLEQMSRPQNQLAFMYGY